jgi:molecular chaperone HscB
MRTTAARTVRASSVFPLSTSSLRTRPPTSCIFCAQRIQLLIPTRRFQSEPANSNTREEPFSPQTAARAAASQTHYAFFPKALPAGPPPDAPFAIDLAALKREFLQLQARAHPDMHPQNDKKRAEALSARINEAYKTLQTPLLRAQYLLTLRGIEVAEDETAKVEDPELLMEVLDAREQIEEAQSEEDLLEMKNTNDARIRGSEEVLSQAFEEDNIELARSEAVKLRYWVNIKESIDDWEKGKPVVLQH